MPETSPIRTLAGGVRLEVRVIPRSPRAAVDGVRDGRLVLRVTAPPVDHAANEAVIAAIADALSIPKRAVRVGTGETSRNKSLDVDGVTAEQATAALLSPRRTR
jgi:uncharacterized protein YggU (UPF0235/DUF167 family)